MSTPGNRVSRRTVLKNWTAGAIAAPFVMRVHATAAPSETLYHASFGASGMAGADIGSLTASKHVKLVAVADVDTSETWIRSRRSFPGVKVYQDWRELLDKEKNLDSVNVSTPDHMHAPITMRAMQQGLHVYTQKPLTQTIYEARQVAHGGREKKLVTQMGIQIHSHEIHRTVVATIQAGAIGKVKEVHSWSGKHWGDTNPRPDRTRSRAGRAELGPLAGSRRGTAVLAAITTIPANGESGSTSAPAPSATWAATSSTRSSRSLALTAPRSIRSEGGAPNRDNWGLDSQVRYVFPGTKSHDRDPLTLDLVRRRQAAPRRDQGTDRQPAALRPGLDLHRHRGRALFSLHRSPRAAARRASSSTASSPTPEETTTISSSSRPAAATARPRRRSTTPARSPSRSCWAAWRPGFPGRPWNGIPPSCRSPTTRKPTRFVRRHYRKGWEVDGLS